MNNNLQELYTQATSANYLYTNNHKRWLFLLESYMGGDEYRQGNHLTRYELETDKEYAARLLATPLDNHCRSVVNVYNSFLFREEPDREFGSMANDPALDDFIKDADLEGRSLDAVMKDVATWSSVFGHCYMLLSKPNIGANTRADELMQNVRPYLSLLTPLVVYDWTYERSANGYYQLTYFKYVEDVNDQITNVIEWYLDRIVMTTTDRAKQQITNQTVEENQLGFIPVIIAYNQRSPIRGIGISDITDIADQQKAIYNELSEIEASIRLDSHPTLVTPENVKLGSGAGAIVYVPETMDPGLRPYLLQNSGADVNSIYNSIQNRIASIDKMANTGAVRATESRTMSGVAMQTEFALLNARLSEKSDNLELAEEQMWRIWCAYQGTAWDGEIEYPGSFSIHDVSNEFNQLSTARSSATTPDALAVIDYRIRELLEDPRYTITEEEAFEIPEYQAEIDEINKIADTIKMQITPTATTPPTESTSEGFNQASCPIATQDVAVNLANRQTAIDNANYGPLDPTQPNTIFWARLADKWSTTVDSAKKSRCGNCAAFVQTSAIKQCIENGLAAGGTSGSEWDTIAAGDLGYCEAWDFKCASNRTCDAWIVGGPIVD